MKLTVDTNVVLRYLLADDLKQASTAREVMQGAAHSDSDCLASAL